MTSRSEIVVQGLTGLIQLAVLLQMYHSSRLSDAICLLR